MPVVAQLSLSHLGKGAMVFKSPGPPVTDITLRKETSSSKVGVRLKCIRGAMVVDQIDPTGPLANSLQQGDKLVAINGVGTSSVDEALNLLRSLSGDITLGVVPVSSSRLNLFSKKRPSAEALTITFQKALATTKVSVTGPTRVLRIDASPGALSHQPHTKCSRATPAVPVAGGFAIQHR